jgi:hypothetical protein
LRLTENSIQKSGEYKEKFPKIAGPFGKKRKEKKKRKKKQAALCISQLDCRFTKLYEKEKIIQPL